MTHPTPRPELEPAITEPQRISPVLGFCSICGEMIFRDQGWLALPGARVESPLLLCVERIRRHEDWASPVPEFEHGGEG